MFNTGSIAILVQYIVRQTDGETDKHNSDSMHRAVQRVVR